jgi:hydrogenase maturation factor
VNHYSTSHLRCPEEVLPDGVQRNIDLKLKESIEPQIGDIVSCRGYDRTFRIVEVTPCARTARLKVVEQDVTTGQIPWDDIVLIPQ